MSDTRLDCSVHCVWPVRLGKKRTIKHTRVQKTKQFTFFNLRSRSSVWLSLSAYTAVKHLNEEFLWPATEITELTDEGTRVPTDECWNEVDKRRHLARGPPVEWSCHRPLESLWCISPTLFLSHFTQLNWGQSDEISKRESKSANLVVSYSLLWVFRGRLHQAEPFLNVPWLAVGCISMFRFKS